MNQDIARDIHNDTGKKVLVVCSGAAGDLDAQFELNAIQDTLYRQGIGYEAVYLRDASDALVQQELQEKIDHGMQGVIVCGDPAFTLACLEQTGFFASLPVFFMDMTDQDLARQQVQSNPLFAGICDSSRLENAISAFAHILPEASCLTVITDSSGQGLRDQKDLQEAMLTGCRKCSKSIGFHRIF